MFPQLLLSQAEVLLGRRVRVEGTVQLGTFEHQKKHAWVSDPFVEPIQANPQDGVLLRFSWHRGPIRSIEVWACLSYRRVRM